MVIYLGTDLSDGSDKLLLLICVSYDQQLSRLKLAKY